LADQRGFNLPETLAVLCLLAIMASIAIPLVAERARLAKIRTMVNQFAFDIRAARWTAVTARHTVDLAVAVDPGNTYEYTDVRGNVRRRTMPEGVRIVASTDPIQFGSGRLLHGDRGRGGGGRPVALDDQHERARTALDDARAGEPVNGERGSSLIEVTLAMGLLAGVLGSIASLFVVGAGEVRSGRSASEALAVARTVIEDIEARDARHYIDALGLSGAEAVVTAEAGSCPSPAIDSWCALLDKLPEAELTLRFAALEPDSPDLAESSQIRIGVVVAWREGSRPRTIVLSTLRL
jgi:prepilin-type N-terminal cleavage/methylation domain-containing protein